MTELKHAKISSAVLTIFISVPPLDQCTFINSIFFITAFAVQKFRSAKVMFIQNDIFQRTERESGQSRIYNIKIMVRVSE